MSGQSASLNVGLVSQYPPPLTTHSRQSGIASYSKNLATALKNEGHCVFVFGNKLDGTASAYDENGVRVTRCWNMGIGSCIQIAHSLWRARRHLDVVHIQYTFALYGGIASIALFPVLLLLLEAARIPVALTLHEVVPLSGLNRAFLEETGFKGNPWILRTGMRWVVKAMVRFSNSVIVHASSFRSIMITQYGCNANKIEVIPHGIEEVDIQLSCAEARRLLGVEGKRVLLFFGYLAKYKGLNRLLDAFSQLNADYVLVIAGGEHPRLRGRREYEDHLSQLHRKAATCQGKVIFTGFVEEAEIERYFRAADFLILPYTTLMSASGPLALCIANRTPFLASRALAGVIEESEILFDNTPNGIKSKTEQFFWDNGLSQAALRYGETALRRQLWPKVAALTSVVYQQLQPPEFLVDSDSSRTWTGAAS